MTTELPLFQVDAFADRPFSGNQACVVPLSAWLPDATLQAIANENNVAETAFIVPADGREADFELRWMTPTIEVALCGHATLAAGHVVLNLQPERAGVRFVTRRAGVLNVERAADGLVLALPAWAPAPTADRRAAEAMGGFPEATLSYPGGYAVSRYADETAIRSLRPDFKALAGLGDVLAIATAPGEASDIVSRVFAPGAGIDEDPVTGSAHAILTPYWAARLGRMRFSAVQASARGGRLTCELAGDSVRLTGACVTTIEGVLRF